MQVTEQALTIVVVEDGTRSTVRFERPVIHIGRSVDNDLRLASKLVSRHHCRIEVDEEGPWVLDLGSANGTMVGGERVRRKLLSPGDEVQVGGVRLQVLFKNEAEPPERPGDTQRIDPRAVQGFGSEGFSTQMDEVIQERENLRVFARITRALGRETDQLPLLRLIVDSAVALVGAERGFCLLAEATDEPREPGGEPRRKSQTPLDPASMTVRIARRFDQSDVPVPSSRLSMGVARHVVHTGRPVLSVDAGKDERFMGMASVEDLRLRSVLCLPIQIEDRIEGVLYLDNRLQQGAFSEDDLDLVEMFAGQAAIAIRNARQLAEMRERNQRLLESRTQIQRLNEQLGRKVRDRDAELAVVRAELERERGRYDYTSIIGSSDGMRRIFQTLDRVIESDLPVLIHGDSGTGKELIARAIHFNGVRKDKPFVTENCAALPDSLLESELFGHMRGAFTGADRAKKGLLEQATGGTLFLDEIGDMSPEMQKKLLRVLQEGEVRPLGSTSTVKIDVRLLAASHRDLEEMVREGQFREDLFYRINVLNVSLPSLRERSEDIPLLAEHLLARSARQAGRPVPMLTHEALAALAAYDWPGNVRELENEMRRLVVMGGETITLAHLSDTILAGKSLREESDGRTPPIQVDGDLRGAVAEFECRAIREALERCSANKSRAASELGISRFALQRKLDKYGLTADGSSDEGDEGQDGEDDGAESED